MEISDDLNSAIAVINALTEALQKGRRSRERSLVVTKLQEARMWAEGLATEAPSEPENLFLGE